LLVVLVPLVLVEEEVVVQQELIDLLLAVMVA
jgi:hypothetical protein